MVSYGNIILYVVGHQYTINGIHSIAYKGSNCGPYIKLILMVLSSKVGISLANKVVEAFLD